MRKFLFYDFLINFIKLELIARIIIISLRSPKIHFTFKIYKIIAKRNSRYLLKYLITYIVKVTFSVQYRKTMAYSSRIQNWKLIWIFNMFTKAEKKNRGLK